MRRERTAAEHIPYTAHVSPEVVKTRAGDYLQAVRLAGASFESADDEQLNAWHERLNVLWRNLAGPGLAIWTHLVRRPQPASMRPTAAGGFVDALTAGYCARLAGESLMLNELYLTLCYRPAAGLAAGALARLRVPAQAAQPELALGEALTACLKLRQTVCAALTVYDPEILAAYRYGRTWCSSLLEYLAQLVNGDWQRVPLPEGPVSEALTSARLLFGTEAVEYRLPATTRVGAFLGIKEYPTPSVVGMFNRLLSAPFPLILTQSFAFLSRAAAQGLLQRQYWRMTNAGDFAVSQAAQLKAALDGLSSNEFVMGEHHFSLQVLAEPDPAAAAPPVTRLRSLNENVARARALLADTGMAVAREDLGLEAAFWAQLPGNFALRPRRAAITSRNLAAMFDSIRSVTSSAVSALDYVARQESAPLAVRSWVQADHGARGARGVLFLPYRAGQIAALRSTISAWMRLAIFEAMNREGGAPLWFVVDELDALGQIDGLKDALARLRKFGGRCVLGFQSVAQVSSTYGAGEAQTLVENCGNTLILRCSGSEHGGTSQFASRLIGEREVTHVTRSSSRRGLELRPSLTRTEHLGVEAAVMGSQIEQLPDLAGYLKLASNPAWLRVSLRLPTSTPPRAQAAQGGRVLQFRRWREPAAPAQQQQAGLEGLERE
ncbi:MAG TPA: type IV secretion system DNA-binding domain-containing protein [Steroidobacteraceae bacterium]|nr:type IV secretion system DNA-binding domain-containing protein [Steroidobacteraceae bacterium]